MSFLQPDGTINMRIIQPGWGSTAFYSSDVLKRDGPKVFTKGLHMHVDHPTVTEAKERPERSVATIGAVLESNAQWRERGPEGPGLYAKARPVGAFKDVIEDLAPHIGVSIRASGLGAERVHEGRKGVVLESLTAAQSVDFVTVPGAGGRIVQLFESARDALVSEAARREIPPAPVAEKPKGGKAMAQEAWEIEAQEAARKATEDRIAKLEESLARATEREQLREAEDLIRRTLEPADLHHLYKARIASDVMRTLPLTEAGTVDQEKLVDAVREGVKREVSIHEAVNGSGRIRGMGSTGELGYAEDQVKAAQTRLEESFSRFPGMTPEAAKIAAAGRR